MKDYKLSNSIIGSYDKAERYASSKTLFTDSENYYIGVSKVFEEINVYDCSNVPEVGFLPWNNLDLNFWDITNTKTNYWYSKFTIRNGQYLNNQPIVDADNIICLMKHNPDINKLTGFKVTFIDLNYGLIRNLTPTSLQLEKITTMVNSDDYIDIGEWYTMTRPNNSTSVRTKNQFYQPLIKLQYRETFEPEGENISGFCFTNPYNVFSRYPKNPYDNRRMNNVYDYLNLLYFGFKLFNIEFNATNPINSFIEGDIIPFVYLRQGQERYALLIKKSKLSKILNNLGIPWVVTVEYDEVDWSKSIEELNPEYKPIADSGQPENELNVGGNGNQNNESDIITLTKPTIQPFSLFNAMYAIDSTTLNSLRNFLWDTDFLTNLKKLTSSPIENIINCRMYPFNISTHSPTISDSISIGNIQTSLAGAKIPQTYDCFFNMGYYDLQEYWGDFADYQNTHIDLYLPYYGFIGLNTDEVMGKRIELYYVIDISTGDCTAIVMCDGRMIDSKSFTIGITVPLTSTDSATLYRNLANIGVGSITSIATGNVGSTLLGTTSAVAKTMLDKRHVEKSGNASALNGLYMPQIPFVTIHRPYKITSSNYINEHGYPIDWYGLLNECEGYCRLADVEIDLDITTNERDELKAILERGFYI